MSYIPQFFVLNLDGLFGVVTNFHFFDVPLLDYYINLRSTIVFCLSSGDMYLSLDISLSSSFVTISELFYCEVFEAFVIQLAISLPIKSPVATAFLKFALFEAVLSASVSDCLA